VVVISSLLAGVRNILTENLVSTLDSLKEELKRRNIATSTSSISRTIKSISYSRKRVSFIPVERNSLRLIDILQIYCREVSTIDDKNLVFLDETGFNLHTV
jgi:hypothetical protein